MGFFKKVVKGVKKGVSKVFKPIVKGLDKITGGYFSKIMGNKWVQYAMMAVAIVTGGIAIANGIMAAGEAGIGAAAKAFAADMSLETGSNLVGTLIEGGKQFIGGVASGLADPLGSEAGQAVTGMFDSAVGAISGTPVTAADELASISGAGEVAGTAAEGAMNLGGTAGANAPIAIPGGTESFNLATGLPATLPPVGVPGALPASGALSVPGSAVPGVQAAANASFDPAAWAGSSGDLMAAGGSSAGASAGMPDGILGKLADGAKSVGNSALDYAKSPQGVYQIGSALQGWSQGQALQEQWDRLDDREKERYRSWTDGSFKMPRLTMAPA